MLRCELYGKSWTGFCTWLYHMACSTIRIDKGGCWLLSGKGEPRGNIDRSCAQTRIESSWRWHLTRWPGTFVCMRAFGWGNNSTPYRTEISFTVLLVRLQKKRTWYQREAGLRNTLVTHWEERAAVMLLRSRRPSDCYVAKSKKSEQKERLPKPL